jgi:hypothetical protein
VAAPQRQQRFRRGSPAAYYAAAEISARLPGGLLCCLQSCNNEHVVVGNCTLHLSDIASRIIPSPLFSHVSTDMSSCPTVSVTCQSCDVSSPVRRPHLAPPARKWTDFTKPHLAKPDFKTVDRATSSMMPLALRDSTAATPVAVTFPTKP